VEPAAESLRFSSPAALLALARALSSGTTPGVEPLRDATCQSFPVWSFDAAPSCALGDASDASLEAIAEQWHQALVGEDAADLDVDLYELSTCLTDLREALRRATASERLFVLLEEKAL